MPDNKILSREYQHREAFCLMKYQTDDRSESEVLWNGRDGVTPFCIRSRSGKEMRHVNWQGDRCAPDHKPAPGDRIFVDATPSLVRDSAIKYVDENWDAADPDGMGLCMRTHPFFSEHGKDWAVEHFIADWTKNGSPYVVTVEDPVIAKQRARIKELEASQIVIGQSRIEELRKRVAELEAERDSLRKELSALRTKLAYVQATQEKPDAK